MKAGRCQYTTILQWIQWILSAFLESAASLESQDSYFKHIFICHDETIALISVNEINCGGNLRRCYRDTARLLYLTESLDIAKILISEFFNSDNIFLTMGISLFLDKILPGNIFPNTIFPDSTFSWRFKNSIWNKMPGVRCDNFGNFKTNQ